MTLLVKRKLKSNEIPRMTKQNLILLTHKTTLYSNINWSLALDAIVSKTKSRLTQKKIQCEECSRL